MQNVTCWAMMKEACFRWHMALNYSQYNYKIYLPLRTNHLKIYQDCDPGYIPRICYFKVTFIKKLQKNMEFLFNLHATHFISSKTKVGRNTSLFSDINE